MVKYNMTASEYAGRMAEVRSNLKQLSDQVKPLVEAGQYERINDAIIAVCYKKDGNEFFKSASRWQDEGYSIIKGSKGFPVWGRAKTVTDKDGQQKQVYRVTYIFSNLQTFKKDNE